MSVARALLAILLFLPLAAAQGPDMVIEDAVGDHVQRFGDQTVEEPTQHDVDIASLDLWELQDGYRFRVNAVPADGGGSEWIFLDVEFSHEGQRYAVANIGSPQEHEQMPEGHAPLYSVDRGGERRFLQGVPDAQSQDPPFWEFTVDREAIPDAHGSFPREGSVLEDFYAEATGAYANIAGQRFQTEDHLPNEGTPSPRYVSVRGVPQGGTAYLTSDRPTAASNGESSTFVFPFQANNLADEAHAYTIKADAVPEEWTVSVWPDHVIVPGNGNVSGSIILGIPFNHVHGQRQTFELVMENEDDAGDAHALEFGMVFHTVPQPAGHHSTVWLHSRSGPGVDPATATLYGSGDSLFMNTLEDDPEDERVPVRAAANSRPLFNFTWSSRLAPSFETGLSWIDERPATLAFTIASEAPHTNAVVEAELYVRAPGTTGALEKQTIASGRVEGLTFDGLASKDLEIDLLPALGRWERASGSEMHLDVRMDSDHPTVVTAREAPTIEPGGRLALPLLEYRDGLEDIHIAPASFLVAATERHATAAPGATIVMPFEVEALADVSMEFELRGINIDWARLAGPARLDLKAGSAAGFALIVDVPDSAATGSVADLVLRLRNGDDVMLTRFLVEVDPHAPRDDRALVSEYEVPPEKASPAPGPLLVLLLGAIACRRR